MKPIILLFCLFAESALAAGPRRMSSSVASPVKLSKRGTLLSQSASVVLQTIPAGATQQDSIPSACTGSKFWDQGSSHCYFCDPFTYNYKSNRCMGCLKGQYFTGNGGECLPCIDKYAATCSPLTGATLNCISGTTPDLHGICL